MTREIVELFNAWMWDCPECGRENFERATHIEREHLSEVFEVEDEDLHFLVYPEMVKCPHCDEEFRSTLCGVKEE
jgi:predicted nucleic-acid-binding Zn-ribbon protein